MGGSVARCKRCAWSALAGPISFAWLSYRPAKIAPQHIAGADQCYRVSVQMTGGSGKMRCAWGRADGGSSHQYNPPGSAASTIRLNCGQTLRSAKRTQPSLAGTAAVGGGTQLRVHVRILHRLIARHAAKEDYESFRRIEPGGATRSFEGRNYETKPTSPWRTLL